jgi:hypothetical protein
MRQIVGSEMLVFDLNQTPGNYPKDDNLNTLNHDEMLKFNTVRKVIFLVLEYLFRGGTLQ